MIHSEEYNEFTISSQPIAGNSINVKSAFDCECEHLLLPFQPTADAYNDCYQDLVLSALRGKSNLLLNYGGTNSGKTYSMHGTAKDPGLLPLTLNTVFRYIRDHADYHYSLKVSYIEIYNEVMSDLLPPFNSNLSLNVVGKWYIYQFIFINSVFVQGATEQAISTQAQIYGLISVAEKQRRERNTSIEQQTNIFLL